jgi:hypothetical protein
MGAACSRSWLDSAENQHRFEIRCGPASPALALAWVPTERKKTLRAGLGDRSPNAPNACLRDQPRNTDGQAIWNYKKRFRSPHCNPCPVPTASCLQGTILAPVAACFPATGSVLSGHRTFCGRSSVARPIQRNAHGRHGEPGASEQRGLRARAVTVTVVTATMPVTTDQVVVDGHGETIASMRARPRIPRAVTRGHCSVLSLAVTARTAIMVSRKGHSDHGSHGGHGGHKETVPAVRAKRARRVTAVTAVSAVTAAVTAVGHHHGGHDGHRSRRPQRDRASPAVRATRAR